MTQGMLVQFMSPDVDNDASVQKKVDTSPAPAPVAGTTMVRKEAFHRVGYFEADHKIGSYMDWLLRARDAGLVTRQHEFVILERRIHDDNIGSRERDSRSDYVKLLKAALDRRRAAQ